MKNSLGPAIVFSIATSLSTTVLAGSPQEEVCENPPPAMADFCAKSMKALKDLSAEQQLLEAQNSPEVLEQQSSQVQKIMLQQDTWVPSGDGSQLNIRYFKTSGELSAFYSACVSVGGQRMIPENDPREVVQGLLQGSCRHPQ